MDFARAENTSRRYLDLILEANKRTWKTLGWAYLRSTEPLTAVMVI